MFQQTSHGIPFLLELSKLVGLTGVIDYGVGNVGSVRNMLQRSGCRATAIGSPADLGKVDRLILPGIGHFSLGMKLLREGGWVEPLRERVLANKTPLLGICLGMQLLTQFSEEGDCDGLGLVDGHVRHFDTSAMAQDLPIPHMGWAHVEFDQDCPLFAELPPKSRFYHVHSYHADLEGTKTKAIAHVDYGYRFVTGFTKDNIYGLQFHPEKSHMFGSQVLRNFVTIYAQH